MTADVDAVDFFTEGSSNIVALKYLPVSGLTSKGTRQSELGQGTPTDIKHVGSPTVLL